MENYKKYVPAVIEDLNPMEVWFKLDDEYEASNLGNIKSLNYHKMGIEFILKKRKTTNGYSVVSIRSYPNLVHRLVWEAFHGRIPEGMEIDHRNTDRTDNRLENLKLCNHIDNVNNPITMHKIREGVKRRTESQTWRKIHLSNLNKLHNDPVAQEKQKEGLRRKWGDEEFRNRRREQVSKDKSKPVLQYTLNEEFVKEWKSAREIERELGYNNRYISECCTGKRKSVYGSIWKHKKCIVQKQ